MKYDGVISKPPLDEVLEHYNHNHDPKSGRFSSKNGSKNTKKLRKSKDHYKNMPTDAIKIMKNNLEEDIKNNHSNNEKAQEFRRLQAETLREINSILEERIKKKK